ncbi:hypothetical protein [Actinomadura madurae]|uniref:hypothetical protein n=1 Tax=Actinomadura madurae TaxID=1993 RepID=UPI0027E2EF6B|nr:hypothetical protein [Actinomadura madurae]
MNSATRIGAYAVGLAVVFGGAAGIGKITGPVGEPAAKMASHENGGGHAGGGEGGHGGGHTAAAAHAPGGLQVSEDGYTLTPSGRPSPRARRPTSGSPSPARTASPSPRSSPCTASRCT